MPSRARRLQMADCDGSSAQTFIHDPAGMHLTIGSLCIDASGGNPGDLVKLRPCAAGAGQIWKPEPKGNFTKLVGQNGLCLDIRYGSKETGAPVQSWNCGDSEPNQLWSFQREVGWVELLRNPSKADGDDGRKRPEALNPSYSRRG